MEGFASVISPMGVEFGHEGRNGLVAGRLVHLPDRTKPLTEGRWLRGTSVEEPLKVLGFLLRFGCKFFMMQKRETLCATSANEILSSLRLSALLLSF